MNPSGRDSVCLSPLIKGGTDGTESITLCPTRKGTDRDRGDSLSTVPPMRLFSPWEQTGDRVSKKGPFLSDEKLCKKCLCPHQRGQTQTGGKRYPDEAAWPGSSSTKKTPARPADIQCSAPATKAVVNKGLPATRPDIDSTLTPLLAIQINGCYCKIR
jgi:hypothetical protein